MAEVTLNQLCKSYGKFNAVDHVSLKVTDKMLMVLVGPSGCGKTTTLRLIAGLEKPTAGEVNIGGRLVNDIPPSKRNIAMVFQDFALYPHMTAFENIAFSLEVQKFPQDRIRKEVHRIAEVLDITEQLDRRPAQLSGGQKQRVALGRAIVRNPTVLLMDEPLSNLDAHLRVLMRSELKRISRDLKTTTIYVTHDQVEAMTMGDRIVVMNKGQIQQVDTPNVVYERPANLFVARLIGSPPMNLFEVEVKSDNGQTTIHNECVQIELTGEQIRSLELARCKGGKLIAGIRPEALKVRPIIDDGNNHSCGPAVVDVVEPQGADTTLQLSWKIGRLVGRVDPDAQFSERDRVGIYIPANKVRLFDPITENIIA